MDYFRQVLGAGTRLSKSALQSNSYELPQIF